MASMVAVTYTPGFICARRCTALQAADRRSIRAAVPTTAAIRDGLLGNHCAERYDLASAISDCRWPADKTG